MDARTLRQIDLFKALSKPELQQLAQWTDEVEVEAGRVLGAEGSYGYEFFVIREGVVEVEVGGEKVAELGPGEWFGEIALLETQRRTATVTAKTPLRLVVVFGPDFRRLAQKLPGVAAAIEAEMRRRLERARA